jgi:hypothetical protein
LRGHGKCRDGQQGAQNIGYSLQLFLYQGMRENTLHFFNNVKQPPIIALQQSNSPLISYTFIKNE